MHTVSLQSACYLAGSIEIVTGQIQVSHRLIAMVFIYQIVHSGDQHIVSGRAPAGGKYRKLKEF